MKKGILTTICFILVSLFVTSCDEKEHICNYSYVDYDESFHYAMCKENNAHIVKQEHNYEYVSTLKKATDYKAGEDQYKCSNCGRIQIRKTNPLKEASYDLEVVDDRFLKEKISDATAIYYKSDSLGNYGNENDVFEYSMIPSEYTEVSYIESDGTQIINTEVNAKVGLSSEIKCYFPTVSYYQSILCARTKDARVYMLHVDSSKVYLGLATTKEVGAAVAKQDLVYKTVLEDGKQEMYCNGAKIYSGTAASTLNLNKPLYLFGNNYDSDLQYAWCKMYYCKIWDEGTLIRSYVPVVRNEDGLSGLYDLVDNRFYATNKTISNFKVGNSVNNRNLPNDYQEVEYIESTGTQCINTRLVIGNSTSTSVYANIIYTKAYQKWRADGYYVNAGYSFGTYLTKWYGGSAVVPLNKTQVIEWSTDYSTFIQKSNGIKVASGNNISVKLTNQPYTIFSGVYNYDTFVYDCCSYMKVFEYKIYQDQILKRDLVPCYRKSDNVAGLYDLVTERFLQNEYVSCFRVGNEIGHKYKDKTTLKEPTLGEAGEAVSTCSICGKKHYEEILPLAYKVDIDKDDGVKEIRVLISKNKDDYSSELTTYTRNKYTYNYSAINPVVKLVIICKDGYEIDDLLLDDKVTFTKENDIYYIEGFKQNSTIKISTKKSTTK